MTEDDMTVDGGRLRMLAGGSCRMTGDDSTLRFVATAPDEASLGSGDLT